MQKGWEHKDIDTLKKLWEEGLPTSMIAKELNKKRSAVTQYVFRNREKLGLEKRQDIVIKPFRKNKRYISFEDSWKGDVPFGHWMITKPWRKDSD